MSIETLLSKAEIPIIDLSHMGEYLTYQFPPVLAKKPNARIGFDVFCIGELNILAKLPYV